MFFIVVDLALDRAFRTVSDQFYFKVNFTYNMEYKEKHNGSFHSMKKHMLKVVKDELAWTAWMKNLPDVVMILGLILIALK